jgi:hypothetical protein
MAFIRSKHVTSAGCLHRPLGLDYIEDKSKGIFEIGRRTGSHRLAPGSLQVAFCRIKIRHTEGGNEGLRRLIPINPQVKCAGIKVKLLFALGNQVKAENTRLNDLGDFEIRDVNGHVMVGLKGHGRR